MDKLAQTGLINPLSFLSEFTEARLAIGRAGNGIPTKAALKFNLDHANARDAVYSCLNVDGLENMLEELNLNVLNLKTLATDRAQYLQRPDFGRRLHPESWQVLNAQTAGADIAIIIADGLSALAIHQNAVNLLLSLMPLLSTAALTVAPVCLVQQGRVAIGDDIGEGLKARLSIVLIGERPGLSAANSMGVYITYQPKTGLTDDSRNCISNIRPGGLSYQQAAEKLFYLVNEALKRKVTGIALKDDAETCSISY